MYILDAVAISPQLSYGKDFLLGDFQVYKDGIMHAKEPDYLEFIPASLLRRMGKAVRMGIGSGLPLIQKYPSIEGVIIGTANGGLEDCIRFLNQIVDYEEGVLTPTNFVNSTPNAIAGQLALMGEKLGYNNTHTNGSLAFDNALLDAKMVLEFSEKPIELLVGAVEEISDYNYNIDSMNKRYKLESIDNSELIMSTSTGSICGEGASMFVVSNQSKGAKAKILGQHQICCPTQEELLDSVGDFLHSLELEVATIDLILLGNSGDSRFDYWYDLIKEKFKQSKFATFKQFCGDYRTANAFACYQAIQLFQEHKLHKQTDIHPQKVLIYNQFESDRHGFILLERP